MKLSKAQEEVMEKAKKRIDFARNHSFYDWFRNNSCGKVVHMTDDEIDALLIEREKQNWIGTKDYEMKHYQMNRDGIDYLCHASSTTIRKLEKLGLIKIIEDSCGDKNYGFDEIKVLNY